MADKTESWNSLQAKERHERRQRRKTLDEEDLFKSDDRSGPFATIYSREETWVTRRDSTGHREKTHSTIRTNQDSHGRVIWERTEEQYDPENPDKPPVVSIQKEETLLHEANELHDGDAELPSIKDA